MEQNGKKTAKVKLIKAHKPVQCDKKSDEDSFVPLAAKDSGWVDLEFQDINRASYSQSLVFGDADDEITIQVIDGDSRGKSPIRLLFPNLSDVDLTQKTSPTDITKMLVGQKPNSKYLKNAKKSRYLQDLPPLVETTSDTFDNANDKAKGEK